MPFPLKDSRSARWRQVNSYIHLQIDNSIELVSNANYKEQHVKIDKYSRNLQELTYSNQTNI